MALFCLLRRLKKASNNGPTRCLPPLIPRGPSCHSRNPEGHVPLGRSPQQHDPFGTRDPTVWQAVEIKLCLQLILPVKSFSDQFNTRKTNRAILHETKTAFVLD